MLKGFQDLRVWQEAKDFTVQVYRITKSFPREEMFGLSDQMRRASNSICANIAEGFSRYHTKDKVKFYYNARGSVSESVSHVLVARELKYLSPEVAAGINKQLESIKQMINAMISSVSNCAKTFSK
jgi:four helix bundle protein